MSTVHTRNEIVTKNLHSNGVICHVLGYESNVASLASNVVSFTFPKSTYKKIEVDFSLVPGLDGTSVYARFGDGAFDTGTNYIIQTRFWPQGTVSAGGSTGGNTAAAQMIFQSPIGGTTGEGIHGRLNAYYMDSGNTNYAFTYHGNWYRSATDDWYHSQAHCIYTGNNNIDRIQITYSSTSNYVEGWFIAKGYGIA